jgi:hypothetical protein
MMVYLGGPAETAFDNLFGIEFFEYLEENPDAGNLPAS